MPTPPASALAPSARPPSALTPSAPWLSAPPRSSSTAGLRSPHLAAVDELHPVLAAAARSAAPDLSGAAVENAVVAAAPLVAAPGVDDPAVIAAGIGATAAAMSRLAVPTAATQAVDWSRFGAVVPVLAGSPGAGASVLAAAVTDALQQAGQRVLLVDAADPARSGLAAAAPEEGLHVRQVHPGLHLRYSWRHESLLARMESRFPITPAMVPPPPAWLPDRGPVHVTVVDVGHDGWRAAADPLLGAGGWLRRGQPATLPILVVRPTRPSLQQAEQVLARLYRWVNARVAEPPAQLVVVGARRWPRGVTGAAGRLLDPLIPDAVFVPSAPSGRARRRHRRSAAPPTHRRPDSPAAGPAAHRPTRGRDDDADDPPDRARPPHGARRGAIPNGATEARHPARRRSSASSAS